MIATDPKKDLDVLVVGGGINGASAAAALAARGVGTALAEGARDAGAAVLTNCAVRGLETEAGRVSAVVTERHETSLKEIISLNISTICKR